MQTRQDHRHVFPTKNDITALKWRGAGHAALDNIDGDLYSCFLIRHGLWHEASHRDTCFKSKSAKKTGICRAKLPAALQQETALEVLAPGCVHVQTQIEAMGDDEEELGWEFKDECGECGAKPLLTIALRRSASSAWMVQCSKEMVKIFGCNNNVQYVQNLMVAH